MADFSEHYRQYWDYVKNSVDEEGWTYSKEVPHILDSYFESNTKKEIDFEYTTRDKIHRGIYRWRPKSITQLLTKQS